MAIQDEIRTVTPPEKGWELLMPWINIPAEVKTETTPVMEEAKVETPEVKPQITTELPTAEVEQIKQEPVIEKIPQTTEWVKGFKEWQVVIPKVNTIDMTPEQIAKAEADRLAAAEQAKAIKKQETIDYKQGFSDLLSQWASTQEIASYLKKNKALTDENKIELGVQYKTYLKTKKNTDIINTYGNMNNEQLNESVMSWDIVVWSNEYNLLSPEKRAAYEEYKKQQDLLSDKANIVTWDATSFQSILTEIKKVFSSDIRKQYTDKLNSPEMKGLESKSTELANQINDLDDQIEYLREDAVKADPSLAQSSFLLNAAVRDASRDLRRQRNQLVNKYDTNLAQIANIKSDMDTELKLSQYEDANNKEAYMTALNLYQTERARMDDITKAKFEAENDKLAEDRKFERDLMLLDYKNAIAAWEWEYKTINDKLYFVKWEDATLVIDAWDEIGWYNEDDWKITTYKNDDGTFSSVFTNIKTHQVYEKTTNAKWEQAWSYLQNLGMWTVAWYGWDYDGWLGLDIDWAMGQPFTAPMWWNVIEVWTDKAYWNYIDIQLDDWNYVRYSHLQDTYLQAWDKFSMKDNLGTIWNTWNVRALDPTNPEWRVPTAEELAKWVWSHLDIVTQTPNGLYRTSKDTERYLAGLGKWTTLNKETFQIQTDILDRLVKDPEVKAFKESFIQNKNLITSLWSDTGAWDMAGIFQFMKALDPRSVVREWEFALAWQSAWLATWTITQLKWILTWEKLDESLRQDFEKLAVQYLKNRGTIYDEVYNNTKILYEQQWLPMSAYPPRLTDEINNILYSTQKLSSWKVFNDADYQESMWAPIW